MRKIESIEDRACGKVTYELRDGTQICLGARDVELNGAAAIIREMGFGYLLPIGRVPVIQGGVMVGTLPAGFDPGCVKTIAGFGMYDPRPGDFRREGSRWVAADSLGPGDLALVVGFRPA